MSMGKSSVIRYDSIYCRKLAAYAMAHNDFAGTNKQAAAIIGCCEKTVVEWKKAHPEFRQTLDDLAIGPNLNVECAIYKSACGHYAEEEKVMYEVVGQGEDGKPLTVPVSAIKTKRYIPPNPAAQNLWAYNRLSDRYKRRLEQTTDLKIVTDERADAELAALLAAVDPDAESQRS